MFSQYIILLNKINKNVNIENTWKLKLQTHQNISELKWIMAFANFKL